MTTSTLHRSTESSNESHQGGRHDRRRTGPNRIRRMQERSAVMVHRHALPSAAISLGAGLIVGLVAGGLLAHAIQAQREPQGLLDRSRQRVGDTLANLSHMVPTNYREWRG